MIAAALIRLGIGEKAAGILARVGLILALIGLGCFAINAWGDARYSAGKADENAAWKAANDALIQKAATSGNAADRKEVPRLIEQAVKTEQEKERIDAALTNGTSPIDALFPAAGNSM